MCIKETLKNTKTKSRHITHVAQLPTLAREYAWVILVHTFGGSSALRTGSNCASSGMSWVLPTLKLRTLIESESRGVADKTLPLYDAGKDGCSSCCGCCWWCCCTGGVLYICRNSWDDCQSGCGTCCCCCCSCCCN